MKCKLTKTKPTKAAPKPTKKTTVKPAKAAPKKKPTKKVEETRKVEVPDGFHLCEDELKPLSWRTIIDNMNKSGEDHLDQPMLMRLPLAVRIGTWPDNKPQIATHVGIIRLKTGEYKQLFFQEFKPGMLCAIDRIFGNEIQKMDGTTVKCKKEVIN